MPRLFIFDNRASNVVPQGFLPHPPDVHRITGATEPLNELISSLTAPLRSAPKSGLLLVAHGNSGDLEFTSDHLNSRNVRQFSAWRSYIHGSVEIHGCGVASAVSLQAVTTPGINTVRTDLTPGSFNSGWGPTETMAQAPEDDHELEQVLHLRDHGGVGRPQSPHWQQFLNSRDVGVAQAAQSGYFDGQTNRMIRQGPGAQFLMAFANAIGQSVTAALHSQMPDPTWHFQGPTLTAYPNGSSLSLTVPRGSLGFNPNTAGTFLIGY